jgi:hypothetical protein
MEDNNSNNENMIQTQVDEETNVNDSDDNGAYNDISDGGWIQWFCQLEGSEFFVEIDEEFFRSRSNLFGIGKKVNNFRYHSSKFLNSIDFCLISCYLLKHPPKKP